MKETFKRAGVSGNAVQELESEPEEVFVQHLTALTEIVDMFGAGNLAEAMELLSALLST